MKKFTVYEIATGQILRTGECQDIDFELQGGPGLNVAEGIWQDNEYYYENGFKPIPPSPGQFYDFNYQQKAWVYNETSAADSAILKRNALLYASDWTDLLGAPRRLGPTKYDEWQIYRQQLRDITNQPNFPYQIDWPVKPS